MFSNLSALSSATGAAPTLGATSLFGAPASTSVPTTNPPSFGFSFPAATTSKPTAAANPVLSGMIGGPSTAKTTPSTGLSLGLGAPACTSAGLGAFKLPTATSQPACSNTLAFPSTGLSTAAKPGFSLPTASTTAATIGIKPLAVSTSTAATTAAPNPLSLGTNPLAGFAKPVAAATTSAATTGFGLLGAGTSSAASTAPTTAAPSIFNKGLDGQVKTASLAQSSNKPTSSGDQNHDTKAVPAEIISQFTEFEKHIKSQKELSANKSTSSKDKMGKVRDQTTNMRQLLATVAMGLHRNVTALEKLKTQTKQSLYDAEMATGTRMMIESGAASAREYTAPDHYFYNLLESFDSRMTLYRRLIEDTEGYIVGAQQGSTITPKDLFMCLKRLHETFIALAAQLQGIHEQIKIQKEQYLAYRKVFHNDDTDVFEVRRREMLEKAKLPRMSQPVGPSPFSGLSNYAAMMLTQAMQAPQQPPTVATGFGSLGQPSTTGLFGGGGGFGTTGITGGGMFGAAAAKPNPFAATTTQSTGLFGAAAKPTTAFGASTGFGTAAAKPTSLFGAASSTATTGTAFGFPAATTKPSNPFGTTTTTPFGATKPLVSSPSKRLALPQTQSLGASAPTSTFNLQAPPNKRPL